MKKNYFIYSFYALISPITLLLIIILYRFNILIRFVPLISERIGHFCTNTVLYYFTKKVDLLNKKFRIIDLVFFQKIIANQFLKKKFEEKLFIFNRHFSFINYKIFFFLSKKISFFKNFYYDNYSFRLIDVNHFIRKNKPFISFTNKEVSNGLIFLKSLGINECQKYVCIIARDEEYLFRRQKNYDYLKNSYRNISLDKFNLVANILVERGYYVIRMGKEVENEFKPAKNNKKIIDYPFLKDKSDFLDIFITANCNFCISSGTGLDEVAVIFKKPIALIEPQISLYRSYNNMVMHIFRKYMNLQNNNILNLSEINREKIAIITSGKDLKQKNIKLLEPSEKEISELAEDMINFINNDYNLYKKDLEAQIIFDENYKKIFNNINFKMIAKKKLSINWPINNNYVGKISPTYLKNNQWLIS